MTFGSLFAGIDGFGLGFERAGMECKWQVEIDDYATRVLEKHWPNVRRHCDIRTFPEGDAADWEVDCICGGFPCQDLSGAATAGERKGLKGARSGLWSEMLRVIGTLVPSYVVAENVARDWKQWVPVVRRDLWRIGYASLPIRVRASVFGAPFFGDRIYVAASNRDREPAISLDGEVAELSELTELGWHWRTTPPWHLGMADGVPNRVDRLRCAGNAVYPQAAEWLGRQINMPSPHPQGEREQ